MHWGDIIRENVIWAEDVFKQIDQHLQIAEVILLFNDIIEQLLSELVNLLGVMPLEYFHLSNLTH